MNDAMDRNSQRSVSKQWLKFNRKIQLYLRLEVKTKPRGAARPRLWTFWTTLAVTSILVA